MSLTTALSALVAHATPASLTTQSAGVAVTATSGIVIPVSALPRRLLIQNTGANPVFLSLDGSAATTSGFALAVGASLPLAPAPSNAITGICGAALASTLYFASI